MGLWLLAIVVGCKGGATSTPPPETAAPEVPVAPEAPVAPAASAWSTEGLDRHMQKHFSAATDGVWYLAHGRLETMRVRVADLAHMPHDELPEALKPYARDMAATAGQWAAATDAKTAAEFSARTAARCAVCHTASGAIPPLTEADVALTELGPKSLHSLAPYLMWVGLVVPSDRAWGEGATFLVGEDDPSRETEGGAAYAELAVRARAVPREERGAIWTEIIQTCAPCHASYGATIE